MLQNIVETKIENAKLVEDLFNALESLDINYCHWKSNEALDRTFNGKNDIDILVDKKDSERLTSVLTKLDFKHVRYPTNDQHLPSMHSFYGYDAVRNIFIHVHLHYHLIFGHGANKTLRIPIEKTYLRTALIDDDFNIKIAHPAFELIYLVIRFTVKYSLLQNVLLRRRMNVAHIKRELNFLLLKVDHEEIKKTIEKHFPFLGWTIFERCFNRLKNGNASLIEAYVCREKMLKTLAPFSIMPIWKLHLRRRYKICWRLLNAKLKFVNTKARLYTAGKFIAVVGGDGAGKTTLISSVTDWLKVRFNIIYIHLGKPPASLLTILFRWIAKTNTLKKMIQKRLGIKVIEIDYFWMAYQVLVARDRSLLYKKALTITSKGGLVISDRFPLHFVKMMDSPKCSKGSHLSNKRLVNWLTEKEKEYYKYFISPDVLLALRVHPDVAVERKTDEPSDYVRRRSTEFYHTDWDRLGIELLDAGLKKEEVLKNAKEIIWANL